MKSAPLEAPVIREKLDKILGSLSDFSLFVAIHDFVEHLESHESFSRLSIPSKYQCLKQVHRGVEDTMRKPEGDLGHDRYMVIQELARIRENRTSEDNSMWRKRDLMKRIAADMYKLLTTSIGKPQ